MVFAAVAASNVTLEYRNGRVSISCFASSVSGAPVGELSARICTAHFLRAAFSASGFAVRMPSASQSSSRSFRCDVAFGCTKPPHHKTPTYRQWAFWIGNHKTIRAHSRDKRLLARSQVPTALDRMRPAFPSMIAPTRQPRIPASRRLLS
jgi:hypothetical protein